MRQPEASHRSSCGYHVVAPHSSRRILRDSIQHRLNVRRRAGNDAQDLTRRSLLLQRFFEFLEQPHVLNRDHRLVGEGLEELDLRRGEGAHLGATCAQRSNEFPLLTKGNGQECTPDAAGSPTWEFVLLANIGNVERAMLAHPANLWLINTDLDAANGYGTKMSPGNHSVSLAESQHHVIDPTNPGRALDDGIEDRLHVRGRAADDAEHLGRCRLMLQRLAQFCVALSDFFEQPHVLDGDDGLVGEGLEERDLFFSEGPDFRSPNHDCADRNPFTKQRRDQNSCELRLVAAAFGFRKLSLRQCAEDHECE